MRRTKEDAEKTRESILNAAVEIFSQQGIEKTSLAEIAKAADVTRGAIYWHFKNKTEIFEALHQKLHQPLADLILQDIKKDHPQPLEQIRDLCINMLVELDENVQKRKILTLFLIRCNYTDELAPLKEQHDAEKAKKLQLLSLYFERARRLGILPEDSDPATLTLAISCYMKGIVIEYLTNPESFAITEKAPVLISLFFKGLQTQNRA